MLLVVMMTNPLVVVPAETTEGFQSLNAKHQLGRDIFRELIEINTTLNAGSTKAANAMAARLRMAGFPEGDIHVLGPGPQHMNLLLRYRGTGVHRPILFIAHLDVQLIHSHSSKKTAISTDAEQLMTSAMMRHLLRVSSGSEKKDSYQTATSL
jgi:hypothetical protein